MSLKKVADVKADKGFRIWDLIIYGVIAALAVILFAVIFATRDTGPLSGIRVYVANEAVFEYDFTSGEYTNLNPSVAGIISDGDDCLTIRINATEGYNIVVIDKSGSVKVSEADCTKNDCVYYPAISDNSGFIYCLPHRLKILPCDFNPDNGNLIM